MTRERLVTAESCTGGWIAKAITDVPGSSAWFECGIVAYSYEAKQALLGVRPETLEIHGAVSRETVVEMVSGALVQSGASIAIAVTGIAGPEGGS
ncbi:MAG TPA: CinA family protein, partial [Xylella fastidiosa subsp. pauca]